MAEDLPDTGGRWLRTKTGQLRRYPETEAGEAEPLADDDAPAPAAVETEAEGDAPAKSKGKA